MRDTKKLLRGSKFSNSHQSIIDTARSLLVFAKNLPEVEKIVIADIVSCKPGHRRIKLTPILAGLKLVVRGSCAQQVFYIYTAHPADVEHKLQTHWEELLR